MNIHVVHLCMEQHCIMNVADAFLKLYMLRRAQFFFGPWGVGRVENRKSWKITKPQVDPIDTHKNKTILYDLNGYCV